MNNLINIKNQEGQLIVSSREIAENFEKRHDHVIRDIENKMQSLRTSPQNWGHLFIEHEYEDSYKRKQREYLLTKDGFSFIVMGFTGPKADQWKLKYIKAFNKMEEALKEVYHISETAIVNNVIDAIEDKLVTSIDERLSKYEENYRPTHANKISLNNYIKKGLGELREDGEVDLVKDRVLILLNAEAWQDVPYERLINSMHLIDESIRAVKSFRTKMQLSFIED